MNWRGKLSAIADLKQTIKWDWRIGYGKTDPEQYQLEYTSKPINSFLFEKTFKKIVNKGAYGISFDDWEENKEIEILSEGLQDKEKEIMTIFPKINLKKHGVLSSSLDKLVVIKTKDGLIIKGNIVGLRKC
jgi:hypothetical protein